MKKHLYKYRSFKNRSVDRIFTHNEIYFPSPLKFDDPFDCKMPISYEGTDREIEDYIYRSLQDGHPKWSEVRLKEEHENRIHSRIYHNLLDNPEEIHKIRDELLSDIGILALSAKCDNMLMFSHYSDGHTGFCIQFDASTEPFFGGAEKVRYTSEYPYINRFKHKDDEIQNGMLLTKSIDWEYEEEWRILWDNKGIKVFPEEALAGVIFGCLMSDEDKTKLRDLVKNRSKPVKLYQAQKKKRAFGLDIVPIGCL